MDLLFIIGFKIVNKFVYLLWKIINDESKRHY